MRNLQSLAQQIESLINTYGVKETKCTMLSISRHLSLTVTSEVTDQEQLQKMQHLLWMFVEACDSDIQSTEELQKELNEVSILKLPNEVDLEN